MILFVPFFSFEFLENYGATIGLWFSNFEFNASIYYFVKWVLDEINGVNLINSTGAIVNLCFRNSNELSTASEKEGNQSAFTNDFLGLKWLLFYFDYCTSLVHH